MKQQIQKNKGNCLWPGVLKGQAVIPETLGGLSLIVGCSQNITVEKKEIKRHLLSGERYYLWTFTDRAMKGRTGAQARIVVQSFSHVQLLVTPWTTVLQASLSFTISQSLLKLMSTKSMMPSKHLILYHPLFLLPSIFPSIRVFSSESALCIRWPKYQSCNFSISPSNEYSTLISFRIDWFDLLEVQGTLKSFLQHHNSKASILRCSTFFMVRQRDIENSMLM